MEFDVLGPLRVCSRGNLLNLGPPAQRALLAGLLSSPNVPVSDDRLVDELWGEAPPPSAHHLVQVYVSRLRALLDPGGRRILRDGSGYAIRVEPDELDAERFLAAAARGRELSDRDPEAADEILADAMRLWRGAPFADFPEPPSMVREYAAYLERQHLEALETWFDIRLQLGRHHELVPELSELVVQHPYDEALHAQLVLALYRCGRQAEALQTARALQVRLREELGIELSGGVRDLYRRILLQAPELMLEPPVAPSNLPAQLTSFVGRSLELREVAKLVETSRFVTLTGAGGIGKTRLALEVAQQLRLRFPGGVWWIDLAPVSDPGSVADEVARVVGLTVMPGQDVVAAVARALGRRRTLLVIDNCEHVASPAAELAAAVVSGTTSPHVLATSRTPLRVEGERLWTVPPLSQPGDEAPQAELTEFDAVRLFVERGRAVEPSFALDADNARAVLEVCRRLDGLALAIEMAAARLPVLTPHEIARHLDDRFALLELAAKARLTRHRTLEAAMDASYILLSDDEQMLFERLSVFAGPFDLDAAAAVGLASADPSGRAVSLVGALVDASLLATERDGEETRYRLLETLREYAAARLREHGGEEEARLAHADYHLGLAAQASGELGTPDFAPWVERLTQRYSELRQALGWSLAHQDRAVTLRAAPALRELWYRRGDAREATRWTTRMLDADLRAAPPSLLSEVHNAAAFAANMAMDLSAAVAHSDEALRLLRDERYAEGQVWARWARAQVAFSFCDLDSMREYALEGLSLCDEHGDRWRRAGPLSALGWVSLFCGELREARARLEEALALYRELGDYGSLVIMTLAPLCEAARRERDFRGAEQYATEAVELGNGTSWEAAALVQYGAVLNDLGELDAAEEATVRGVRVALDAGFGPWFRMALRELARTAARRAMWETAVILLSASRRDVPALLQDPAVYRPLEELCRNALGEDEFERLAARGEAMTQERLMELVGTGDL